MTETFAPLARASSPIVGLGLRWWPALAALASAAMLATAHAFETFGRYEPCPLCYRQREIYWFALAVAAAGAWFWARKPGGDAARSVAAALGGVFVLSGVVALYHAGIEWDWWLGPDTCTSGGLPAAPIGGVLKKPVLCDEAAWRMAGLSMAGWNALVSVGLAGLSFAAAFPNAAADARERP